MVVPLRLQFTSLGFGIHRPFSIQVDAWGPLSAKSGEQLKETLVPLWANLTLYHNLRQWDIATMESHYFRSFSARAWVPFILWQCSECDTTDCGLNRVSVSTMPLISKMVISNVSVKLNGTRVDCSYGGSLMSTTFISVIKYGMNQLYQNHTTHITTSSYHSPLL